jgi:hypothetical protein
MKNLESRKQESVHYAPSMEEGLGEGAFVTGVTVIVVLFALCLLHDAAAGQDAQPASSSLLARAQAAPSRPAPANAPNSGVPTDEP